jgi:hypothetical protein
VLELGFLTAAGQRDSHAPILADGRPNGSPRAGQPYRRITWHEIRQLVEAPAGRTKDRAHLVILSTYAEADGRTHEVQRNRGQFGALAVDIDKGSPTLADVLAALRAALGDVAAEIYSSSSSTPDVRKWRVLLPLAAPISGTDYPDTQTALFGLLQAEGLVCDHALARAAQPVFLPNVPPQRRDEQGRPLFYQWHHAEGRPLELVPGNRIVEARETLREKRAAEAAEAAQRAAAYRDQRAAHVASTGDTFDPIEHYKQTHSVADRLARYGFVRSPKQRGSHWQSPLSDSGSYSTEDRGDHWVTVSAWAHNHNVGRVSKNGNRYGDAFDLYAFFEHNGDRSAAVRAYAEQVRPRRPGLVGTLARVPAVRVEPAPEQVAELVEIDQYRRDIVQALADVVIESTPGFKLLRGDPGTGKTYAVSRAVARYSGGITSVPGHELAAEVVEQLRAAGANAAAYPRLDETTCANYETAARAQAAGLSAPATVCGKCPLVGECRVSGYLAMVRDAESATHRVVTHARLARSAGRLLERAEYVVLEEDPSSALAPMVSAPRRQLERLADLASTFADAQARVAILERTELLGQVETFDDFDAWAPAGTVDTPTGELAVAEPPPRRRRTYPRGFFGQVCRVADELAAAAARALVDDMPDGMHEIRVEPTRDLPKNPEGAVWAALNTIERVDADAALGIAAETMQLAIAVATGRAERVFVQVETDARPGGKRSVELVAMWRTRLPAERLPVFVNDGTLDAEALSRVARAEVRDITPTGRVPLLHHATQYPVDILPTTSSARVAEILAGIVRAHADKPKVGVLLHQRHYRELIEADDSPLPADVRDRIVWGTYFQSGADRGTNALHRLADLAVIIGTHRPPPSEIRRTLARWGELEAAAGVATWGRVDRHGVGHDGGAVPYHGRGYAELAWAQAADATIRATMRQAVGRARAIDPNGVAVVAVTSEAVGLPIADPGSLPVADDRAERVLEVVKRLAIGSRANGDKNPIDSIREIVPVGAVGGVPLEQVAGQLPEVDYRTVKRWVARAVEAGDLVRVGNGKAVRYWLAGRATSVVATTSADAVAARKPEPAKRAPVSLAPLEVHAPGVVELPAPVARPPRPTPPPPVVAEQPGADWLERVLAPNRHPDERLALEFYLSGPHAERIGVPVAWQEETPPLVLKLHKVATAEAKRYGQPPPPVEIVARHTVAWYSATMSAIAG